MGVGEKKLGERLQLARKRAGLTQQQLCQRAGLSYSTLAKIERGAIRSPSIFTVASIASATATPLDEILTGFVKPSEPVVPAKKTSKTGIKFVYFDISGVLVSFSHKTFADIARDASLPVDSVEAAYWRYNDRLNKSQITITELNRELAKTFGLADFDWEKYYFKNLAPITQGQDLYKWIAQYYEVGLISNHVFIEKMQQKGLIPRDDLAATIDSSKVGSIKPEAKIYKIAQRRAGVSAGEILLIDNERPNLVAADKLGWRTAWFDDFHASDSVERIKKLLEF